MGQFTSIIHPTLAATRKLSTWYRHRGFIIQQTYRQVGPDCRAYCRQSWKLLAQISGGQIQEKDDEMGTCSKQELSAPVGSTRPLQTLWAFYIFLPCVVFFKDCFYLPRITSYFWRLFLFLKILIRRRYLLRATPSYADVSVVDFWLLWTARQRGFPMIC